MKWFLVPGAVVLVAAAAFMVFVVQHPRLSGARLVRETPVTIHCGLSNVAVDVDGVWYRFLGPANEWSPRMKDINQGVNRVPFGWDQIVSIEVYDTGEGLVAVGPLWSSFRLEPIDSYDELFDFTGCI